MNVKCSKGLWKTNALVPCIRFPGPMPYAISLLSDDAAGIMYRVVVRNGSHDGKHRGTHHENYFVVIVPCYVDIPSWPNA